MQLHVSGPEAHNCLAYFERAMQKWEREQANLKQLTATRDRTQRAGRDKKIPQKPRKPRRDGSRPDLGAPRRCWTPENLAACKSGIESGWSTHTIARHLNISQKTAWLICTFLRQQPQPTAQPST